MAVLARLGCPASAFVLEHAMAAVPEARYEFDRVVAYPPDAVGPLLWASGPDAETIREALEADPSVREVALLATAGDGWLYGVGWSEERPGVLGVVLEAGATVTASAGSSGRWNFQAVFPDRDALSEADTRAEDAGVPFEVNAVYDLDGVEHDRYGLTQKEREALVTGFEHGYYDVPHRISTADLGDILGVSHQAVSQRLRRGHGSLVAHTLVFGHGEAEEEPTED